MKDAQHKSDMQIRLMDVLKTEHKNLGSNPTINDRAVTATWD